MASSHGKQMKMGRWLMAVAISAGLTGLTGQLMAQDEPTAEIQLGDANDTDVESKVRIENPWIGVAAAHVDDALRAHMEIPGNSGLIIREVAPESPAEKAGLREFDVLIRADKNPLASPQDLVEIVKTWDGQTDGIKIEWLRRGEELSEIITPIERPDNFDMGNLGLGGLQFQGFGNIDIDKEIGKQLREMQRPFGNQKKGGMRFRFIGPGMQAGSQSIQSINENGLKITIKRENDDPAEVSVDDGESTWEVTENDLDQLPEELAERVQQLLKNKGHQPQFQFGGNGPMPNLPIQQQPFPDFKQIQKEFERMGIPQMQERFDEMERQMQKMIEGMERLQPPAVPADEDAIDPDYDA